MQIVLKFVSPTLNDQRQYDDNVSTKIVCNLVLY